jgi:hypothetical protein
LGFALFRCRVPQVIFIHNPNVRDLRSRRPLCRARHTGQRPSGDLAQAAGTQDPDGFADSYTVPFDGALVLRHVHVCDNAARSVRPLIEQLIEISLS